MANSPGQSEVLHAAASILAFASRGQDSAQQTRAPVIPLSALADHCQVHRTIEVEDLLAELQNRGWFAYPPEVLKQQGWEIGVALPDTAISQSELLPVWEVVDEHLTWDVIGRSHLKAGQTGSLAWPENQVITSTASLFAVLRQLDSSQRHSVQRMSSDDHQLALLEDTEAGANGEQPFPLGRPATLSSLTLSKPMFNQSSKPGRPDRALGLPSKSSNGSGNGRQAELQRTSSDNSLEPVAASASAPPQPPKRSGQQNGSAPGGGKSTANAPSANATRESSRDRDLSAPSRSKPIPQHQQTAAAQHQQLLSSSAGGAAPGRVTGPVLTPKPLVRDRDRLHRVLRMGWRPLVDVVCNSLTGRFLGGHDKDLYIQCTGPEYSALPLVDIKEGGCIMTCAQFEKRAGRELSKKWKESIHVVGDSEGSRATLITWLRRQAAKKFGERVISKQCWIRWCSDGEFYQATVIGYNMDTGKHKVRYSESLYVEELHLPVELIHFTETKPALPELSTQEVLASMALYHEYRDMDDYGSDMPAGAKRTPSGQMSEGKTSPDARPRSKNPAAMTGDGDGDGQRRSRPMGGGAGGNPSRRRMRQADADVGGDHPDSPGAKAVKLGDGRRHRMAPAEGSELSGHQMQKQSYNDGSDDKQGMDSDGNGYLPSDMVGGMANGGGNNFGGTITFNTGQGGGGGAPPKLVQLPNGMTGIAVTFRDLLQLIEQNSIQQAHQAQLLAAASTAINGGVDPNTMTIQLPTDVLQPGLLNSGLLIGQGAMASNNAPRLMINQGGGNAAAMFDQRLVADQVQDLGGSRDAALYSQLVDQMNRGSGHGALNKHSQLLNRRTSNADLDMGGSARDDAVRQHEALVIQHIAAQTTGGAGAEVQLRIPADVVLPAPPLKGYDEDEGNEMVRWLVGLGGALEEVLANYQRTLASPLLPASFGLALRFQTMVAFASEDQLRLLYVLLLSRWDRNQADRTTQARVITEAIATIVYQSNFVPISKKRGSQ